MSENVSKTDLENLADRISGSIKNNKSEPVDLEQSVAVPLKNGQEEANRTFSSQLVHFAKMASGIEAIVAINQKIFSKPDIKTPSPKDFIGPRSLPETKEENADFIGPKQPSLEEQTESGKAEEIEEKETSKFQSAALKFWDWSKGHGEKAGKLLGDFFSSKWFKMIAIAILAFVPMEVWVSLWNFVKNTLFPIIKSFMSFAGEHPLLTIASLLTLYFAGPGGIMKILNLVWKGISAISSMGIFGGGAAAAAEGGAAAGGAAAAGVGGAAIAGTASIAAGIIWMVVDAIRGALKFGGAGGALGGALGGMDKGLMGAFKNMGKYALIGAGIGLIGGPVGVIGGGLIGAAIGAVLGYIGGEKLAGIFSPITKLFSGIFNIFGDLWDSFKGIFSGMMDGWNEGATFKEKIVGAIKGLIKGIVKFIFVAIKSWYKLLWEGFKFILRLPGMIIKLAWEVITAIPSMLYELWKMIGSVIFGLLADAVDWIGELFGFENVGSDLLKKGEKLWADVEQFFVNAWNMIKAPFVWIFGLFDGSFVEWLIAKVEGTFAWILDIGGWIWGKMKGVFLWIGSLFGGSGGEGNVTDGLEGFSLWQMLKDAVTGIKDWFLGLFDFEFPSFEMPSLMGGLRKLAPDEDSWVWKIPGTGWLKDKLYGGGEEPIKMPPGKSGDSGGATDIKSKKDKGWGEKFLDNQKLTGSGILDDNMFSKDTVDMDKLMQMINTKKISKSTVEELLNEDLSDGDKEQIKAILNNSSLWPDIKAETVDTEKTAPEAVKKDGPGVFASIGNWWNDDDKEESMLERNQRKRKEKKERDKKTHERHAQWEKDKAQGLDPAEQARLRQIDALEAEKAYTPMGTPKEARLQMKIDKLKGITPKNTNTSGQALNAAADGTGGGNGNNTIINNITKIDKSSHGSTAVVQSKTAQDQYFPEF